MAAHFDGTEYTELVRQELGLAESNGETPVRVDATKAEEDKKQQESYIALITLTKEILETCIDLLGIQCPDRM